MKKICSALLISLMLFSFVSCGSGKANPNEKVFTHDAFEMSIPRYWYLTKNSKYDDGSFEVFYEKKGVKQSFDKIRFRIYPDSETFSVNDEEITVPQMLDNMMPLFDSRDELDPLKIGRKSFTRNKFISSPSSWGGTSYIVTVHNCLVGDDLFIITTEMSGSKDDVEIYTNDLLLMLETLRFRDVTK
ncbi:MAG: hypothetical protein R2883_03020 [Caldisericia bacterium]